VKNCFTSIYHATIFYPRPLYEIRNSELIQNSVVQINWLEKSHLIQTI